MILEHVNMFVVILPRGARARDMIKFLQEANIDPGNYDNIMDSIVSVYPDIEFPLQKNYPLVFFTLPDDVQN